jgi:hypothetical protein
MSLLGAVPWTSCKLITLNWVVTVLPRLAAFFAVSPKDLRLFMNFFIISFARRSLFARDSAA